MRKKPILRSGARGAIAAMAMSGLRQFSTSIGLMEKVPPEAVLEHTTPRFFRGVPAARRPAIIELAHWSYGAFGGALFGALPESVRRHPWAGPAYGLLVWAGFQAVIAPALGLPHKDKTTVTERLTLLADHVLYGIVVAASPWPHHDIPEDAAPERPTGHREQPTHSDASVACRHAPGGVRAGRSGSHQGRLFRYQATVSARPVSKSLRGR
ncbi:hypothetical protein [Nonomuraea sp. NPDC049129]|uniref:hypothetical protein n=1 Tax=Nonomuraea sp. NPDC049129 TaxID=3155272 RepID=UPI0033CC1190